jgi:endonuclease/exonuclease/phosphatase family metal-dependent hydrolase
VVRLTNAVTHIDVAVVHLRVPRGADGSEKQKEQNRALLRWTMRHLAQNPKANVMILGDFNEGKPVGSPEQNLAVLFQSRPPMVDVFDHFKGKTVTHAGGGAYDRILISDGLFRGSSGLRFNGVTIQKHSHGKGEAKRLYTDHFPVSVTIKTGKD